MSNVKKIGFFIAYLELDSSKTGKNENVFKERDIAFRNLQYKRVVVYFQQFYPMAEIKIILHLMTFEWIYSPLLLNQINRDYILKSFFSVLKLDLFCCFTNLTQQDMLFTISLFLFPELPQATCLFDDCWSGLNRETVWLQPLTYIHTERSNACYVNSSANFSGKLFFAPKSCWTNPCPVHSLLFFSDKIVTTVMIIFIKSSVCHQYQQASSHSIKYA